MYPINYVAWNLISRFGGITRVVRHPPPKLGANGMTYHGTRGDSPWNSISECLDIIFIVSTAP